MPNLSQFTAMIVISAATALFVGCAALDEAVGINQPDDNVFLPLTPEGQAVKDGVVAAPHVTPTDVLSLATFAFPQYAGWLLGAGAAYKAWREAQLKNEARTTTAEVVRSVEPIISRATPEEKAALKATQSPGAKAAVVAAKAESPA